MLIAINTHSLSKTLMFVIFEFIAGGNPTTGVGKLIKKIALFVYEVFIIYMSPDCQKMIYISN